MTEDYPPDAPVADNHGRGRSDHHPRGRGVRRHRAVDLVKRRWYDIIVPAVLFVVAGVVVLAALIAGSQP